MEQNRDSSPATSSTPTSLALGALVVIFSALAAAFVGNLWGRPPARQQIALVDKSFLEKTPWRQTYADLVRAKEDLSDFD